MLASALLREETGTKTLSDLHLHPKGGTGDSFGCSSDWTRLDPDFTLHTSCSTHTTHIAVAYKSKSYRHYLLVRDEESDVLSHFALDIIMTASITCSCLPSSRWSRPVAALRPASAYDAYASLTICAQRTHRSVESATFHLHL